MAKANFTIRCSWCFAPTVIDLGRKPPIACPWCRAGSWLDARDPKRPYRVTAAGAQVLRSLKIQIDAGDRLPRRVRERR